MQETRVQSLGQEDPLEKGMVTPLQYFCLEYPMDRGTWWATVHGVAQSWTRLSNKHFHTSVCDLNKIVDLFVLQLTKKKLQSKSSSLFLKVIVGTKNTQWMINKNRSIFFFNPTGCKSQREWMKDSRTRRAEEKQRGHSQRKLKTEKVGVWNPTGKSDPDGWWRGISAEGRHTGTNHQNKVVVQQTKHTECRGSGAKVRQWVGKPDKLVGKRHSPLETCTGG